MGIPMDPNDDIHTPTVPAGPTSGPSAAGRDDLSKLTLDELIAEKERLESELKVLGEVLQSHGVTMSTPLTTFDGYPRDDLDIAQIRTTRARIIPLRNDYKTLMNAIETAVHARFASLQDAQRTQHISSASEPSTAIPAGILNSAAPEEGEGARPGIVETPFAKVASVAASSPAAGAGLKAGDKVRVFGGVNWMNHENLAGVARVVAGSEGRPLQVKVSRPNENGQGATELTLQLTPRRDWGGRGLLGCHLVPL